MNQETFSRGDAETRRKTVLDFSHNTAIATSTGYSGKFKTTNGRYVRVNMLKNSANPFVHMVELIVDNRK